MKFRVGEILTGDTATNANAPKAKRLDRLLNLSGGEVRVLQGCGCKGDEPIWLRCTEFDQSLVLHPNQFRDGIALGPVPVGIDAECLNVDPGLVHLCYAVADT